MNRYIVKKEFEFYVYDGHIPVKVEEGNLVSYEIYTREPGFDCNNAIKITVHGPDGDIILDGPNKLYLGEYLREIEFSDLKLPKSYIKKIHEEGKHTQVEQNEANYNKRINTAAVLNYFRKITISKDPMDKHVIDWISSEIEKLEKEYNRLKILGATDKDIIQTALIEYGNQERYNNDVEIANKITDVRNRYLELLDSKDKNKDKGE